MIKRVRLCCLILIILILSGCHAEYNINIKNDLKIEEEITILNGNNKFKSFCATMDVCINTYSNYYDKQGLKASARDIKAINGRNESGIKATYTYNNFDEFKTSNILMNRFYDNMNMTTAGDLVTLNFNSIKTKYQSFVSDEEMSALLTDLTLKIKVPYEVTSNDADDHDKLTNTYSWHYDELTLYKSVNLTFNKNKVFKASFIDKIRYLYEKGDLNAVIFIGGAVIILGSILAFFAIKNTRSNKI